MGIRRSTTEQAVDINPYRKSAKSRGTMNDVFRSAAVRSAQLRGSGSFSMVVNSNRKPGRNKAAK